MGLDCSINENDHSILTKPRRRKTVIMYAGLSDILFSIIICIILLRQD